MSSYNATYMYTTDYQLMTWSKDRTLRVWGISDQLRGELGAGTLEQSLADAGEEETGVRAKDGSDGAMQVPLAADFSGQKLMTEPVTEQSRKYGMSICTCTCTCMHLYSGKCCGHLPNMVNVTYTDIRSRYMYTCLYSSLHVCLSVCQYHTVVHGQHSIDHTG